MKPFLQIHLVNKYIERQNIFYFTYNYENSDKKNVFNIHHTGACKLHNNSGE